MNNIEIIKGVRCYVDKDNLMDIRDGRSKKYTLDLSADENIKTEDKKWQNK